MPRHSKLAGLGSRLLSRTPRDAGWINDRCGLWAIPFGYGARTLMRPQARPRTSAPRAGSWPIQATLLSQVPWQARSGGPLCLWPAPEFGVAGGSLMCGSHQPLRNQPPGVCPVFLRSAPCRPDDSPPLATGPSLTLRPLTAAIGRETAALPFRGEIAQIKSAPGAQRQRSAGAFQTLGRCGAGCAKT